MPKDFPFFTFTHSVNERNHFHVVVGGIWFFKSIEKYCTTIICSFSGTELSKFKNYLIFKVTIANTTHNIVTIQNRVTILLSLYPNF
jgi:hypothetical protein